MDGVPVWPDYNSPDRVLTHKEEERFLLLSATKMQRRAALPLLAMSMLCGQAWAQENGRSAAVNPTSSADTVREPVVYEKVRGVIRYGDDGTGTKESSARIRVQTYTGIKKVGQLVFPYKGANERVEVKSLKVIKPDGTVITAGADAIVDVSSPVAIPVARPVVVRHHDLPVFRPASRGHKSAAIPGALQVRRIRRSLLLV